MLRQSQISLNGVLFHWSSISSLSSPLTLPQAPFSVHFKNIHSIIFIHRIERLLSIQNNWSHDLVLHLSTTDLTAGGKKTVLIFQLRLGSHSVKMFRLSHSGLDRRFVNGWKFKRLEVGPLLSIVSKVSVNCDLAAIVPMLGQATVALLMPNLLFLCDISYSGN